MAATRSPSAPDAAPELRKQAERDAALLEEIIESGMARIYDEDLQQIAARILAMGKTLDKIATWFEAQASRNEEAAKGDRFKYVADARIFDAKNYRAMAKDARAALRSASPNPIKEEKKE